MRMSEWPHGNTNVYSQKDNAKNVHRQRMSLGAAPTQRGAQGFHRPVDASLAHLESKIKKMAASERQGSIASDISTAVSSRSASRQEVRTPSPEVLPRAPCHLIWCDQRAFKESSMSWKAQLEARAQLPVKAHKTAEKCIRLLRKKQHSQVRPPCVFLVSWANAPTLLPYINESPHVVAKAILLCDTDMCRGRGRDAAEKLASVYPFVSSLAASWSDAVEAATAAAIELQTLHGL